MPGNLVKSVMLKIVADDGDSEAKLDRISAKADELARKHPDIKVKIDSAAASAKLAVLRQELKDTAKAADQKHTFNLSSLVPAIGQMSMFQKLMMGLNVATTFAEPLLAGVTVAAGGLASGLAAAGAGLGAFGLVAEQNLKTAGTAANAVQQAQITYNASIKSGVAQAKAYQAEQVAIRQAYAQLSPAQIALSKQVNNVQNAWQSFVQSNTSGVSAILRQGMGLLPGLFRDLQGFMKPVEGALHSIITQLGTGLKSAGFQDFLHTLQANSGPAIEKLATAIGHVIVGIGGILKAFMPVSQSILSGLDSITGKFAQWGTTLSGHSGFQSMMSMFHSETPLAVHALGQLAGIIKTVVADMTGLDGVGNSKTLLQLANPVLALVNALMKANPDVVRLGLYLLAAGAGGKKLAGVFGGFKDTFSTIKGLITGVQEFATGFSSAEAAAAEGASTWSQWGGKVSSAITAVLTKLGLMTAATEAQTVATEEETAAQTAADVAMDANPIGAVIIAITALIAVIVLVATHWKDFEQWGKDAWHAVQDASVAAWHAIESGVIRPLEQAIDSVISFFGRLLSDGEHNFDMLRNAVVSIGAGVISWFEQLPGRIIGFLAALPGMMWRAGVNAIMGLIHGIESMAGDVGNAVSSIASKVAGFFGLSPAREGPLAGGGAPFIRGQHFAQDLAAGMVNASPSTAAAAAHLAGMMTGATGGAARPAGGGQQAIVLEVASSGQGDFDQFMATWIRKYVRIRGGNVQTAFGRP